MQGLTALERQHVMELPREEALRRESLLHVVYELLDRRTRQDAELHPFEGSPSPDRDEVIHRLRILLERTRRQVPSRVEGAESETRDCWRR
jgi:hypothetical protein